MSKNKGDKTSFWEFLKDHRVEVPIIQRDYAQGRAGKEFLRNKFLEDLKGALDNKSSPKETVQGDVGRKGKGGLVLDFVYGSQEGETIRPLDGQQRLTTLWLLHWYIALRAGELEGSCKVLERFTYETRISSREFCENLCEPENFKSFDGEGIVDFIENQTWFYSAWKQDPTIQSMLRMLSGTEGDDDGIERVFEGDKCEDYWEKLTTEEPIVFYYMPLKDFGLSDDLYVKMNSRGKPLTPFENFKADLIGYLSKRAANDENWKPLYETIPAKLDNDWTDIFWDKRSNKNKKDKKDDEQKIDEIYFAFLNRFFWNELFVAKTNNEYVLLFSEGNSSFKYLDEDSVDEYLGIECYKFLDGEIPISVFENLEKVLDNYKKYKGKIPLLYGFKDFKFIPEYNDYGTVTKISNRAQRVIFFALCKYFKEEKIEGEDTTQPPPKTPFVALKRWMRVVCNLVSGGDLAGAPYPTVRNALEYISKLESHTVLKSLCVDTDNDKGVKPFENADSAFKQQWNEEIIKAEQILDDERGENLRPYETGKTWENVIIKAENYSFFEGAIRFLFQDENGEKRWNDFAVKFKNAKTHFKKYLKSYDASLLKMLISWFEVDEFNKVLWQKVDLLNNRPESWRYYLTSPHIPKPVNKLLMSDNVEVSRLKLPDKPREEPRKATLFYITQTNILDLLLMAAVEKKDYRFKNFKIDKWANNEAYVCIYRYHASYSFIYFNTGKYDFLKANGVNEYRCEFKISFDSDEIRKENPHFENLHFEFADIYFGYKNYNYLRYGWDGFIYLLDPNDTEALDPNSTEEGKFAVVVDPEKANSKNEKYHCFNPWGLSTKDILKKLEDIAKDWENSKNHTPPEKEE